MVLILPASNLRAMASSAASDDVDTSNLSQDVFLEPDETGRVHLAENTNAGNHFFRSLAELNRTKFTSMEPGTCDRVALSVVHTVWSKGQGKIYVRNTETDEWTEASRIGEAQNLVLRALETLLGVEAPREVPPAIVVAAGTDAYLEEVSRPSGLATQSSPTERRHSATTLEAASSLLLVQAFAADLEEEEEEEEEKNDQQEEQQEEQEEKSELQVKFENTNIAMIASSDSHSSSSSSSSRESDHAKAAGVARRKKPETRRKSACRNSDFVSDQPGMEFSSVGPNDILCGGSGEGVLAIRHEGNKRFLKMVEAEMADFEKCDDKGKLRIAQQAAEQGPLPRGRFLAYSPDSELWHELKRDKAWFKSLRTFLKRQQPDQADGKQRALPVPVRRPTL